MRYLIASLNQASHPYGVPPSPSASQPASQGGRQTGNLSFSNADPPSHTSQSSLGGLKVTGGGSCVCLGARWGAAVHSLSYKFTVTPNGQPWCEIQGQVNGNTFLHYTCGGDKVRLISVLEMNATQAWSEQRDALQYVVEELKKTLLDIKAEIPATSGPLSLQGSMMCEQESNVLTTASWEFGLDGQISLCFDSENGHWTVLHGEGRLLKQTLASDRATTNLLIRT
ncbi:UL16-binding protein 6-like [Myotis myotis]|uniref:UL16-binding protein 6-like n=1 Tax=Myotis myotis TaxID=51298 RepID=UPI001748538C|nr:UL16-binding protein 6-like [Myotis myotis]